MEANRLYRAEFEFVAEEDGEVSVSQGQLVVALPREAQADPDDGWALVETVQEPRQTGFVPIGYLSLVESPTAGAHPGRGAEDAAGPSAPGPAAASEAEDAADGGATGYAQPAMSPPQWRGPSASSASASPERSGSRTHGSAAAGTPPPARHSGDEFALTRVPDDGSGPPSGLASAAAATAAMKSEEFAHLFEAHDQWFRQALSRRQNTFTALSSSVGDLNRKLTDGEARAKSLAERLGKLEAIVEQERKRWTDQLEKEREALGDAAGLVD
ncbi:hypothetical protein FNF27_03960 [Cafeteria roenbergensis]|uniref:SH3 domain-containing protein n=2 Tax=Cafeteria roenbergensis TaxID=33653 RepID=A0A5A8E9W7_CAFRO|nr:hypothetical protein FNF29_01537 [Cafeteria roenbergensis]KAA0158542.1 hypothetical protein FNF28_06163 [Cafeteria roenbergensis]KAA0163830.1 hypothetical protein FNF31_02685 [Cafeteria roenbergensis]KAA0174585.1 hypothetical protein FNF27_03960 [Cafeteria roenbergensis]|eukprot:KAA0155620.1 hypothetical protein FNF29_01537 [Cafeteria roenbergensis]